MAELKERLYWWIYRWYLRIFRKDVTIAKINFLPKNTYGPGEIVQTANGVRMLCIGNNWYRKIKQS